MSSTRAARESPISHMDIDDAEGDHESGDEELARELEVERQKILAAANQATGSSIHGKEAASDARLMDDDDDSDSDGVIYGEQDSDVDDAVEEEEEEDSQDEWQPPAPASKPATRRSKRGRRQSSSEDSDDGAAPALSEEDLGPIAKKSKQTAAGQQNGKNAKAKTSALDPPIPSPTIDGEAAEDSFDEEAERVQAEVEAAAAWADVRRRKEAAATQAQPSSSSNGSTAKPPSTTTPSLTAWLGKGPSASSSTSELASSLPMPTTSTSAQIVDRNSLFIGYVYPLTSPSAAYISTLLSHLTRVVHPTVPTDLLPPQFANAPANKRGSSHDMYAYRVFELKRGRTGLSGPDDFSLQEDKEDDGERWGGDRVLKVARDEGASDVLVVVSRWYGGELLGPVRFDHIETAARCALEEHMRREEVEEFRQRIQYLDRRIGQVKQKLVRSEHSGESKGMEKYEGLTVEKGQRLWLARQKALDALERRLAGQSSHQTASASQTQAQGHEPQVEQQPEPAQPDPTPTDDATMPTEAEQAPPQATVKQEPSATRDPSTPIPIDEPTPASAPTVKAEPTDLTIPPARIKAENDPPPPALPPVEEIQDDKTHVVKAEDEGEDLTGWDDLS